MATVRGLRHPKPMPIPPLSTSDVLLRRPSPVSISVPSGKRKVHVKLHGGECAIFYAESGAVSLLLLLLARAGASDPGPLCVYQHRRILRCPFRLPERLNE
jgi:hypothetical protein